MNDDEAILTMVDPNIYRENILPSEKAFAYKMKYDANIATINEHISNIYKDKELEKI